MLGSLLDLLFPPRDTELALRSEPEDGLVRFLDPAVTEGGVIALLPYDEPLVRAAVLETKFYGSDRAARMLGNVLAVYLQDELPDRAAYEERKCVLVPVPLSRERLRNRGYNQAEMIARYAAAVLKVPVDATLLTRIRDTAPQTSLDGNARRRNLRGAFVLARAPDPEHLYIVIDDVTTTGSTLCESVRTLMENGTNRMLPLALADSSRA